MRVRWPSGGRRGPWGIQPIDESLSPTEDVIGITGEPLPPWSSSTHAGNEWLTVLRQDGGWWVAGTNTRDIHEYVIVDGAFLSRRVLVADSRDWGQTKLDVRHFESVQWGDETWLAFHDQSSSVHTFRVVRVEPECTYESMYDLTNGQ